MSLRRVSIAFLLATACTTLFATRVFTWLESVRVKVSDTPVAPIDGIVRLSADREHVAALPSPFAIITRIHNLASFTQQFTIVVDDIRVCDIRVPARTSPRIDCAESSPRAAPYADSHEVVVRGSTAEWTLD